MEQIAVAAPTQGAAEHRGAARQWVFAVASLGACFACAAVLQFGFLHVPEDGDTEFHFAVGRLIASHGILHAFPWTPFSMLAEHYADKELLFHLLFVPFAKLDVGTAANIVGTICGGALLSSIWFILRRERVWGAGAWAVVPLLASSAFVYRFSLVRPHLLSIGLAALVLWAASRRQLLVLAFASAIFPWTYVAWLLPIALTGVAIITQAPAGEQRSWRPLFVSAIAVAAGVALHPNASNLLHFTRVQLVDVLLQNAWGSRAGIELGDEFRSFTPREWGFLLVPPVVFTACAAALGWRDRRRSATALAFAAVAVGFGILTLRTARFTEYFVPFSVIAFALTAAPVWRPRVVLAVTAVVCCLYSGRETLSLVARMSAREPRITDADARMLASRIPVGAQVFTCDWGSTGPLMLALPERRFMVALDPTFFAVHDPRRYALWFGIPRRPKAGVAQVIREEFGADFVACLWEDRFRKFFNTIAFEPGVSTAMLSETWSVYDLRQR